MANDLTARGFQRRGPAVGGEVMLGREPAHVADLAQQLGSQHRADPKQPDQAGLGLGSPPR